MFNKEKYKKCVGHLVAEKTTVILVYLIIFAILGGLAGVAISANEGELDASILMIGAIIGGIIGLLIGMSAVWRIDMKIQEAYWRIDMLDELKKHNEKPTVVKETKEPKKIEDKEKAEETKESKK